MSISFRFSPKGSSHGIPWKWIFLLIIIFFVGIRWWNTNQEKLILEATKKQEHALYIETLTSMIDHYNANDTWQKKLIYNNNGSVRYSPIMTSEVRSLWFNGPIMATGNILDIDNGMLSLDIFLYDQTMDDISLLWTPIEFHLVVKEEQEKNIIELCRRDTLFRASINVIASITGVNSKTVATEDGRERYIVGRGVCLDFLSAQLPGD